MSNPITSRKKIDEIIAAKAIPRKIDFFSALPGLTAGFKELKDASFLYTLFLISFSPIEVEFSKFSKDSYF